MVLVGELNVIVVGVGGQGQLFLSRLIAETFLRYDTPTLVAETHGMSQRGGSVIVHVRIGRDVRSPLIPVGQADVMLGMELIETVRYSHYIREEGVVLANDKVIVPPGQGVAVGRDELVRYLESRPLRLVLLPSSQRATSLGIPLSANVHLFGALVALLEAAGIFDEKVDSVVESLLPRRYLSLNTLLYRMGKEDLKPSLNQIGLTEVKKILTKQSFS